MKPYSKEEIQAILNEDKFELKSTQTQLSLPLLNRLAKKMSIGLSFPEINICEGMIINGHHRYIASYLTKFSIGRTPANKVRSTTVVDWKSVKIIEIDYDRPEEIDGFLELDAKYNNISLEELIELLE